MSVMAFQPTGFTSFFAAGMKREISLPTQDIAVITVNEERIRTPFSCGPSSSKGSIQITEAGRSTPYKIRYASLTLDGKSVRSLTLGGQNTSTALQTVSSQNARIFYAARHGGKDLGFLPVMVKDDTENGVGRRKVAFLNLNRLDYFDPQNGVAFLDGLFKPFTFLRNHALNDTSNHLFLNVVTKSGAKLCVNESSIGKIKPLGFFHTLFSPSVWGKRDNYRMIVFKSGRKVCVQQDKSDDFIGGLRHPRDGSIAALLRNRQLSR